MPLLTSPSSSSSSSSSSPKRRKISMEQTTADIQTNTNSISQTGMEVSDVRENSPMEHQSSILSTTKANFVPFNTHHASSSDALEGHRKRKRKRADLHSESRNVLIDGPGKEVDAQQYGLDDQYVRSRNGFTFMDVEDRPETPVNGGIASRRNDGLGGLNVVQEVNIDSGDELPLPSSIHSICSYKDSPPKGLLYSSPSGCRRRKTKKVKKKKFVTAAATEKPPSIKHHSAAMEEAESVPPIMQTKTVAGAENVRNRMKSVTNTMVVEDIAKEKTEEIARLQRRIAGTEDDIWALQRQIEMNEAFQIGKFEEKVDTNNLLDIVLRYLEDEDLCNQHATPIPLSKSLTSFLPFAKPIRPTTPPPKARPPSFPVAKSQPSKAVKPDDPIPYLRSFTPLNFTRTISRDPESSSTGPTTVQSHTMTFRSPGNLLEGTIQMTYDIAIETITRIRLLKISKWADQELGSWIRRKTSDDNDGHHEEKDRCNISIIAWAMGRYWDLALARARCWVRCEKAQDEIVGGWVGAADASSGTSRQRRKKAETNKSLRNGSSSGAEEESAEIDNDSVAASDSEMINELAKMFHSSENSRPSRQTDVDNVACAEAGRDTSTNVSTGPGVGTYITSTEPPLDVVSPHLGRQVLKLHGGGGDVELFINYRIKFDWTGEAQSVVDADLVVPRPWREVDERDALGKVPILFEHMKKHGSVYDAVRVLLKLIYT